jgi:hypothetical protein
VPVLLLAGTLGLFGLGAVAAVAYFTSRSDHAAVPPRELAVTPAAPAAPPAVQPPPFAPAPAASSPAAAQAAASVPSPSVQATSARRAVAQPASAHPGGGTVQVQAVRNMGSGNEGRAGRSILARRGASD